MKNVCIIVQFLRGGGAERTAANLSKDLSDCYNVFLVLYDAADIVYPYAGEIIDLHAPAAKGVLGKILVLIKRYIRLKRVKAQYDIAVSISFMPGANLLNVLTKRKEKVILSIRNMMSLRSHSQMEKKLISWCGKRADVTVSLSDGVNQDLLEHFDYRPDKVVTIYNSCSREWFFQENGETDRLIEAYDFSHPVLVTVGRLEHQKGQWHLLRALSLVRKQIPDCRLVIFGQGELERELRSYAEKLGVSDCVFFPGFVKNHHKFMEKCELFVFPSLFEGLGSVVLEALACGMPVLSADCPFGPSEILNPSGRKPEDGIIWADYGVLIEPFSQTPFDVNDMKFERSDHLLADAICRLLTDEALRAGYKSQAAVRIRDFSPKKIKEDWIKVIETI